jgi:hypothetical protein
VSCYSQAGIIRKLFKSCHLRSSPEIHAAVAQFNLTMKLLIGNNSVSNPRVDPKASHELVCHVLEQAYGRCVAPKSHMLRDYEVYLVFDGR